MAYDSASSQPLLFGGVSNRFLADTWVFGAPAFTSANSTTFTARTAGSFSVTAAGSPTPALSESGFLPTGVTFTANGDGTATVSGTPRPGTGGTYPVTITAHNGITPDATQSFTLTVDEAPSFSSPNSATFTVGTASSFTVTTNGYPAPGLTEGGTLPAGVTFVDNHDGTATLSGTPTGPTGTYVITLTAANGIGASATQSFTLTVTRALVAPAITSIDRAALTVGMVGQFVVTATGNPTPALAEAGSLPTGVTFVDNGNGTATLSGTPQSGTGGAYPLTLTASNGVGANATQSFTLSVDEAPSFKSAPGATFSAGRAGSFTVRTGGFPTPALAEAGSLPTGVTFVDNGNGTATLSGTPQSGTGGAYPLTLTASNGVGANATQTFTLTVRVVLHLPFVSNSCSGCTTLPAAAARGKRGP